MTSDTVVNPPPKKFVRDFITAFETWCAEQRDGFR